MKEDRVTVYAVPEQGQPKHLLAMAPAVQFNARLAICDGCDSIQKPLWRCKECGCMMQLKVRFAIAKCPLGLW
jgi:hypothetical protein